MSKKQKLGGLPAPLVFIAVGVLLVATALRITMGQPGSDSADHSSPAAAQALLTATATPKSTGPYPDIHRISPTEAKVGMDSLNALMVDVRTERDYNTARIAGSIHIPAADFAARYQELPKDRPIYLYCT